MDAYCGNCGENLGKVTQLDTELYCSTCGNSQPNWELKKYYPEVYRETLKEEKERENR